MMTPCCCIYFKEIIAIMIIAMTLAFCLLSFSLNDELAVGMWKSEAFEYVQSWKDLPDNDSFIFEVLGFGSISGAS